MALRCVLLSGATGLVGRALAEALVEAGVGVRALSRSPSRAGAGAIDWRSWDGVDPGAAALVDCDAVVHLAGEPLFGGLPTRARLARVRASRIDSTRRLVERITAMEPEARPRTLVVASAVGFYGDRGEAVLEETAAPGTGYLADLCRDWEAEATKAAALGVRVVVVRIGVVLARAGGALALMKIPFSLGLGGRLGSGRQFFPWIHLDDLVAALRFALDEPSLSGPINAAAPAADRNLDLTAALAAALHRPAAVPVPAFAVELALGPLVVELLGSKRVVPARLVAAGFRFRYATLAAALDEALRR